MTRTAEPSDARIVARLLHDFNTEFDEPDLPDVADVAVRFAVLLAREDVHVVLAERNVESVGFAYLTLRPTPYHDGFLGQLEELYVVPALRDRGIGTLLLTTAITDVRAKGAAEVHINVDEVDVDTRRFYERHGFVNVHPGKDYRMLCYLREL